MVTRFSHLAKRLSGRSPPTSPTIGAADDLEIAWAWKETSSQISRHPPSSFAGDPSECWIKYDNASNATLEATFQGQGGEGTCDLGNGYVVDFLQSQQTKQSTGYVRKVRRIVLSVLRSAMENPQKIWCWKESKGQMHKHDTSVIYGNNPSDCWIKYDANTISILESAFHAQGATGSVSPCEGYVVNFATMKQKKISTGFEREVQRVDAISDSSSVDLDMAVWAWKETLSRISRHPRSSIAGDPAERWIKYDRTSNTMLETVFQRQGGEGTCDLGNGYVVDLLESKQTKKSTGYVREVKRITNNNNNATSAGDKLDKIWCWKESKGRMKHHDASVIYGNPSDCWIKYDNDANSILETAFQTQGARGVVSPCDGYMVNFATMKQMKTSTGFERKIQRVDGNAQATNVTPPNSTSQTNVVTQTNALPATMGTGSDHQSANIHSTSAKTAGGAYDLEIVWAWQEMASQMSRHPPHAVAGNPSECWIKYDNSSNTMLEAAFQSQGGLGTCDLGNGHVVDFLQSEQTETLTGSVCKVQRILNVQSAMDKPKKKIWCWKESNHGKTTMEKYDASVIYGDPSDRWVKYNDDANSILETAFQAQGGNGSVSPSEGYIVNFTTMKQTNSATGFARKVQRVDAEDRATNPTDFSTLQTGTTAPDVFILKGDDAVNDGDQNDNDAAAPIKLKVVASKEEAHFYQTKKASRPKYLPFGVVDTMTRRDSEYDDDEDHNNDMDMPNVAKNTATRHEMKKAIGWWSSNQHYKPAHVKKLNGDVKRAVKLNRAFESYHSLEMLPIMKDKIKVIERPPKRLERNDILQPNSAMDTDLKHQETLKELEVSDNVLASIFSTLESIVSDASSTTTTSSSSSEFESKSDSSDDISSDSDDELLIKTDAEEEVDVKEEEEFDVVAGVGADFRPEDSPDIMTLVMQRQQYSLRS